ncbi:MAG: hypothetical protein N2204_02605, partial [Anaerolineae bacterium]|nr:hypothetical protein [Anaerolineae bacterium]
MYVLFTLLYLATVALSVAVAYDPALAWKPGGLLTAGALAALGIAAGGRRWGDRALMAVSAGCALLAAAVGAYFLLSYDWMAAGEGKFAVLRQVGLWVQAHRPALPLPEDINANVAGAALALLLPMGVTVLKTAPGGWKPRPPLRSRPASAEPVGAGRLGIGCRDLGRPALSRVLRAALAAALALGAVALILTGSRGAWAGIAAGAGVAA